MHRNRAILIGVIFLTAILSWSCAPGPNAMEKTADGAGNVAGFWKGIWQGLISPVTFVISLFTKDIRFYEVHNNGGWYNFGFVLGAGLFLGGGIFGRKRRRKN